MASMFVFKKCFYHRILIWITFFFLLLQLVHIDRKMRAPFAWNNKNKKNLWIQLVDCCQSSSSNVFLSLSIYHYLVYSLWFWIIEKKILCFFLLFLQWCEIWFYWKNLFITGLYLGSQWWILICEFLFCFLLVRSIILHTIYSCLSFDRFCK